MTPSGFALLAIGALVTLSLMMVLYFVVLFIPKPLLAGIIAIWFGMKFYVAVVEGAVMV